jgi:hypothetical protein
MYRLLLSLLVILAILPSTIAQEALNLPTELYILLNSGQVERYGIGADGVKTITPDDTFVIDFGVATDDNWIAYRTPDGLYISNVNDPAQAQQLDNNADVPLHRGTGDTLAWSPDDRHIAYTTRTGLRVYSRELSITSSIEVEQIRHVEWSPSGEFLAAETIDNIWWIYRRIGTEFQLTSVIPTSYGITWESETTLIFAPSEGGLLTMDLNNYNAQTTLLPAPNVYHLPIKLSNTIYRVLRSTEDGTFGQLVQIRLDDTAGITTEDIGGTIELGNIRWSSNGSLLIAYRDGVMALVDPVRVLSFTLPVNISVSYDWGHIQSNITDTLNFNDTLYFLGEDISGSRQIWTVNATSSALGITPASNDITDYDLSSDWVGFASEGKLWLYNQASEQLNAITDINMPQMPQFNPAGTQITYATPDNTNGGIWVYTIADNTNTQLLINNPTTLYTNPQWSPNTNVLLIHESTNGITRLSVFDIDTQQQIPLDPYDAGFWLQDGRILAWQTNASTTELVIINPDYEYSPALLSTLPPNTTLEHVQQTSSSDIYIITRQNLFGPAPQSTTRITLDGNIVQSSNIPPMINPILSRDGSLVYGLTKNSSSIIIYSLEANTKNILQFPIRITKILWK